MPTGAISDICVQPFAKLVLPEERGWLFFRVFYIFTSKPLEECNIQALVPNCTHFLNLTLNIVPFKVNDSTLPDF